MTKKRNGVAILKSMVALRRAHGQLVNQSDDLPHLMVVNAPAGSGKTEGLKWLARESDALYMRMLATDSAVAFLSRLMNECNLPPNCTRGNSVMTVQVAEHLQANERTLIVDEGDYLFSSSRLIETLRDIHDLSGMPVIIAGHTGIEKRIANKLQLHSRVSKWLEFPPLDLEDLNVLIKSTCSVQLADDMLEYVLHECRGNLRLIRVGLERIEDFAQGNSLRKVTREDWGRRKFYLTHRAA